ncbi:hypothetical protein ABZS66_20945 [Dactylosporangium sp. NPDC005572]|uniref:hypothetical protein n=1 Tax=Dactylosporangium sp. NPDC005572 TaxID=3156889 RepID=UPI0033AE901B
MNTSTAAAPSRSSLDILGRPWVFSQRIPLDTKKLLDEAKRRGVGLDLAGLRELYRLGVLAPLVELTSRRVGEPIELSPPEPLGFSSLTDELRRAASKGQVRDPAAAPFRRHVAFERPKGVSYQWHNGLLYSHYQLLMLSQIEPLWARRRVTRRSDRRVVRLPEPHARLVERAGRLRDTAIVLAALEARYLPKLDPAWVHLQNTEFEEWERYRDSFDPREFAATFDYPAGRAQADAESLLMTAQRIDPLGRNWGSLARRAPHRSRDMLSGAALQAMDCREAAEILLLYYEDLARRGAAEPLPTIPSISPHHLHERLSAHDRSLDEDLQRLGLSPHPRVVLVVEGETEEELVPRVREYADLSLAPELVRVLTLRGVGGDLTKVAALAAAPLVGERHGDNWTLIKPPTMLFIAVDPEGPYTTPDDIAEVRRKIIEEIVRVLSAQGVAADPTELDQLVHIRTWNERCFELEHFDDDELTAAIVQVHTGWPQVDQDRVRQAVQRVRQARQNIDNVWTNGRPELSKRALARELWPVLAAKIDHRRADHSAPLPPIVDVLIEAEHLARRWQYGSFVLKAAS